MGTQAFCPAGTEIAFASLVAPSSFTTMGEVTMIDKTGQKQETDDATNHGTSSAGYREYISTIKDGGEYTIDYNLVPGNAAQEEASDTFDTGDAVNWKLTMPDGHGTFTFVGIVVEYGNFKFPVDKKATGSLKVKVTGQVVENFGS